MFDSRSKKEAQERKAHEAAAKEKEKRLLAAAQGRFGCWLLEAVGLEALAEHPGARCFLYGTQATLLELKEDGFHFGALLFYRGQKAAAIGSGVQSATMASLLTTAATTHTVRLVIPWGDVSGCANIPMDGFTMRYKLSLGSGTDSGERYRALFFCNQKKQRQEWIGFGIVRAEDDDIQTVFLENLARHGVPVNTPKPVTASNSQPPSPPPIAIPPLPPPDAREFFVFHTATRQTYGPVPGATIKEWITMGRLTSADHVCEKCGATWLPLSQSPFAALIGE